MNPFEIEQKLAAKFLTIATSGLCETLNPKAIDGKDDLVSEFNEEFEKIIQNLINSANEEVKKRLVPITEKMNPERN